MFRVMELVGYPRVSVLAIPLSDPLASAWGRLGASDINTGRGR